MKGQNRQFTKFISLLKFPGLQYFVCEVHSVREREIDGSDVTIVTLKLVMSLHFPLPKIRTFRFSLHTSHLSPLKVAQN